MRRAALSSIVPLILLVLLSVPSVPGAQVFGLIQNPQTGLSNVTLTSGNWAGYVAASGKNPSEVVTAVYGSWIVQTVSSSLALKVSSQWIGIGGFFQGDTTLIQTGTESNSHSGTTTYSVWWEALPAAKTAISEPVSPGDVVQASVTCVIRCTATTQLWTITITDVTKGWTFTKTIDYSSKLKSAEWIEERPAACVKSVCKVGTLADFGTASYGQDYTQVTNTGSATIAGATLPIGLLPFTEITMQNSGGPVMAQPSSISADGTSFTVQWLG
jgi:hypothetical protein